MSVSNIHFLGKVCYNLITHEGIIVQEVET